MAAAGRQFSHADHKEPQYGNGLVQVTKITPADMKHLPQTPTAEAVFTAVNSLQRSSRNDDKVLLSEGERPS